MTDEHGGDVRQAIERRTAASGKTYSFLDDHNPNLPVEYWYQNSDEGLTLFVVFYGQACRWAQCLGCNLPSKMSRNHVPFQAMMKQTDFLFDYVIGPTERQQLHKVILSNNGSILDEDTFSTTALVYFIAKMNMHCRHISTMTIETRAEYVDMAELEILARVLKEGNGVTDLELAIGFEAFDDRIRNEVFLKGLSLKRFESLARDVSQHGFKLKTYFMVKPVPEMTEAQAIEDIKGAIAYLDDLSRKLGLDINVHLNPTYVARGTALEVAFREGRYQPPRLETIALIVAAAEGSACSIFVGLNDEGLAVDGGGFIRPGDEPWVARLEAFNKSQDYRDLEGHVTKQP